MGLRDRLRRLTREAQQDMISFKLEDGSTARFHQDEYMACLVHEFERGRRAYFGEEPGPAHSMIMALRNVSDAEMDRVIKEHGTLLGHLLGEDEILRGERERPGPPAKWNAEGTVCQ